YKAEDVIRDRDVTGVQTCALPIAIEGGRMVESGPVARARGTTVEVRDLFFNTPARRKFMRAPSAEAGHVSEAVLRLGLAHAEVGVVLRSGGRAVLTWPGG